MDSFKLQAIQKILEHLKSLQGDDLKSRMMDSQKPSMDAIVDTDHDKEMGEASPEMDELGQKKPKGIAIEKVQVMGKPEGEDEPSDEELEELIRQHLKG